MNLEISAKLWVNERVSCRIFGLANLIIGLMSSEAYEWGPPGDI
jgi:hypothetical protein